MVTAEEERQQDGPGAAVAPAASTPLDQAFDTDSLYALRSAVAAHATAAGMGRHQVYDVTAVAHELAANAVLHGAGHGRLRLWTEDKYLYCQVSDDGRGDPGAERRRPGQWLRGGWPEAPRGPRPRHPGPPSTGTGCGWPSRSPTTSASATARRAPPPRSASCSSPSDGPR